MLYLWSTENQRLAVGATPRTSAPLTVTRRDKGPDGSLLALHCEIREAYSGPAAQRLVRQLSAANRIEAALSRLLRTVKIRALVVATQEHAFARLACVLAADIGLPTAYIPHAPTALNRHYRDLPAQHGLVAGEHDMAYYRSLGAPRTRLQVVGNPAFVSDPQQGPEHATDRGAVCLLLAAPPGVLDQRELSAIAARVRGHGLRLVVSGHPRGRARAAQVADWLQAPVWRGRSLQFMQSPMCRGVVAETSTGALLEAMMLARPAWRATTGEAYLFERVSRHCIQGLERFDPRRPPRLLAQEERSGWWASAGMTSRLKVERVLRELPFADGPALDGWPDISINSPSQD